jgi:membrane dipeptidase
MDDEQLMALKANGGVMQTVAFNPYVKEVSEEKSTATDSLRQSFGITGFQSIRDMSEEQRAAYDRGMEEINKTWPRANVQDFVDHIDYAVKLIGLDHVGISSDFDGGGGIDGWNNAAETFNVTLELVRRGYTEEQIAQLWSGNLLRVWREVERIAADLQKTS